MKRKMLSVLLCAAMMGTTLAGATSVLAADDKDSDSKWEYKEATLTFLIDPDTASSGYQAVFDLCEKETGIHIETELRASGGDGDNQVKTRLASGEMTDLCGYNSGAKLNELDPESNFIDISGEEWASRLDDTFASAVSAGSDSAVYGVPLTATNLGCILYNKDLYEKYETLEKISFDYAVVEHEKQIEVLRYHGEWKDLGTWNTLTEAMDDPTVGEAILSDTCENVNVVNELKVPVLCMGLKNVVVSAGPDGILVSDKEQSSYIKPYVDDIDKQIMFAEKSWGSFRVLDVDEDGMTIKVTLNPGHGMNYHSHSNRDEIWSVLSGEGRTIVDGMEQKVKPGDVVTMAAGCRHTIIADTKLQVIEVQLGREISVYDKQKYELEL